METKDKFFQAMEELGLMLTFDDVRLLTGFSQTLPRDINVATMFSRRVGLKIPIVSAAMDTVTEADMAIAMAKLGGLGIIHRGMDPVEQAEAVAHVKKHMNAVVNKPISVRPTDTIRGILKMKKERDYQFNSFLVTDTDNKLLGLVTGHHFDMCENEDTPVSELMVKAGDLITAPVGTSMEVARELMRKHNIKHLPLVDESHRLVSLFVFSDIKRIMSGDVTTHNVDDRGQLIVGAAIGTGVVELEHANALIDKGVDVLVIDSAHAFTKDVIETLQELKRSHSKTIDIVVGNVSMGEAAKRLVDEGADGIKVGQGPGSICTTREVAGSGQTQVTAIYECVKAIEGSGVPVCADGGISMPGHVSIAIGVGAHSVMVGGYLAGTDETPGESQIGPNRKLYKVYRGMGSPGAMKASLVSRKRYRQPDAYDVSKSVAEGIEKQVLCQGPVARQIEQLVGGLRSGMGYVGAANIEEMRLKGKVKRMTNAGMIESRPHDIIAVPEAPDNWRS